MANEKERGVEDRHAHRVFHHVHPGRTSMSGKRPMVGL